MCSRAIHPKSCPKCQLILPQQIILIPNSTRLWQISIHHIPIRLHSSQQICFRLSPSRYQYIRFWAGFWCMAGPARTDDPKFSWHYLTSPIRLAFETLRPEVHMAAPARKMRKEGQHISSTSHFPDY